MPHITLQKAKQHLLVIHNDDDDLIYGYIEAAESFAAQYMGRTEIADVIDPPWLPHTEPSSDQKVPKSVEQAILLIIGDFYENRQEVVIGTISTTLKAAKTMLHLQRIGLGI